MAYPKNNWELSQNQIQQLLCASYEDIFSEVCTRNLESEFADDNNDHLRYYLIHAVVRQKHPDFSWPDAVRFKIRSYPNRNAYLAEHGIFLGPSVFIIPWPLDIDVPPACSGTFVTEALDLEATDHYLSGSIIAGIARGFENAVREPASEGNTGALEALNNPAALEARLRILVPSLPANVSFEVIQDTLEYKIKYLPREDDPGFDWVVELPALSQEQPDEQPDNVLLAGFAERCPIPCLD